MNKYHLELKRANVIVGSGGGITNVVWGTITGDIKQQTDLQAELTAIKESIPEPYNDTEIKEDIASLESTKADKADLANLATKEELNNKQDTLVSGTTIKTINSQSLLGEGNIEITSSGSITVDSELSTTSENPVQNKVITTAINSKQDAGDYALKSEIPDTSTLATKTELTDGLAAKLDSSTYSTDKSTFALKTEIPDTSNLATKEELNSKANTSDVYTKTEVDSKIDEAITGGEVDLSNYYTKSETYSKTEVDSKIPDISGLATKEDLAAKADASSLSNLATKEELATKADSSALSNYATKTDLDGKLDASTYNSDKAGFASKTEIADMLTKTEATSTYQTKGNYATKDEIPDISNLATKAELPTTTSDLTNDSGYITSIPDEYITETELEGKGYAVNSTVASTYATKTELNNKLDSSVYTTDKPTFALKTELPDTYTKNEIDSKIASVYKYKGSVANYEALPSDNTIGDVYNLLDTGYNYAYAGEGQGEKGDGWDSLSGVVDLTEYIKTEDADSKYVAKETGKSLIADTEITRLASVTNYNDTEIKSDISAIQSDLNNKVTNSTLTSNYYNKTDADSRFITDTELNSKGYITNSALAGYALKTEIPSSLPANGGNADTVNNKTVLSNVPANAVFTDTVYNDTELRSLVNTKANSSDVYTKTNADNTFIKKTQITFSTSEPSGGSNGDIWFVYE